MDVFPDEASTPLFVEKLGFGNFFKRALRKHLGQL